MYLDQMFDRYMDWKLLRYFLQSPDKAFYTKELARKLNASPSTVNSFLRNLHESNLLHKEIIGNVHLYKLNNDIEIIKHLKIINTLLELHHARFTELLVACNDTIHTIALYGSHANGENDSKSDIDLLLILDEKRPITPTLQQLENVLHKAISVQMMTISDWKKLKEKDIIFYESILNKHIILYGSGLP